MMKYFNRSLLKTNKMTIGETKNWTVFISPIVWHEIGDKIDTIPIEILINNAIQLHQYGKGVKEIICKIIVDKPPSIHTPFLDYDVDKQIIYIGLKLPYKTVETASEVENRTLMQHAFLKGIQTMSTLKGLEQYNFKQLHQAVEAIFFPTEKKE